MSVSQEQQSLAFGSGRLYATDASGNLLQFTELQDIMADFKADIKEAFSESNYAFATADGHRSIDITAKAYLLDPNTANAALAGGGVGTNSDGVILDEAVTVATHAYTVANTTGASILSLVMTDASSGNPLFYDIVGSGDEVAGESASFSAGTITFASGDTNTAGKVTYKYTIASPVGQAFSVTSTFQNSAPTLKLDAIKRDASRVDGSTRILQVHFYAVRFAGMKFDFKEGDFNVYEYTLKAFANPQGQVCDFYAYNK